MKNKNRIVFRDSPEIVTEKIENKKTERYFRSDLILHYSKRKPSFININNRKAYLF